MSFLNKIKGNTLDAILIAVMIALCVLWLLLGLGFAETGNDVYLGSILVDEAKNYTPEQKKALADLLISLHRQTELNCELGAILSLTEKERIHYYGRCLVKKQRPPPEVEI